MARISGKKLAALLAGFTTCDAASALFTPYGEHAQYAICSPIVDEWGNIYFKNDSVYMMKIGARITKQRRR